MITIKKAKIQKGIFLSYSYNLKERDVENKIDASSDAPIHVDLRNAFKKLIPHFALILEEISQEVAETAMFQEIEYEEDQDPLEKYFVTGIAISGTIDSEGVVISGSKMLKSGDVVSFPTPFMKWDDKYVFMSELTELIEELKQEVLEYLDGKQAPKAQIEMSFPAESIENAENPDFEVNVI